MEGLLCSKSLPPGFRFHPTDEELFMYYLKRKVMGKSLKPEMIADVDVYRYAPWELPPMASLKTRDLNWYFFCPRARKYPNGGRSNRATECGFWKSTGNDRTMVYDSRPVGKIKTLVFHRGKAPKGERTDWVMHEYRLEDKVLAQKGVPQESYVICKIYEKSGVGPKNGEHYGAPFVEEEWDSDDDDNHNVQERGPEPVPVDVGLGRAGDSPDGSISGLTSVVSSPNVAPFVCSPDDIAGFSDGNVTNPSTPAGLVGTPFTASVGNPYITDANVTNPSTTAVFVGTPFTTMGNPNTTDAYLGSAYAFTSSAGTPSTATAAPTVAGSGALDEDELNRMLSYFTDELDNGNDFFNDLGDLAIPSGQVDLDWGDIIEIEDLK